MTITVALGTSTPDFHDGCRDRIWLPFFAEALHDFSFLRWRDAMQQAELELGKNFRATSARIFHGGFQLRASISMTG